jgi:hypothetical protein
VAPTPSPAPPAGRDELGDEASELGVDLLADEELELGLTLTDGSGDELGELHDRSLRRWRAGLEKSVRLALLFELLLDDAYTASSRVSISSRSLAIRSPRASVRSPEPMFEAAMIGRTSPDRSASVRRALRVQRPRRRRPRRDSRARAGCVVSVVDSIGIGIRSIEGRAPLTAGARPSDRSYQPITAM